MGNPSKTNPWALAPEDLEGLDAFLAELRPEVAVECGSGLSTAILREHCGFVVSYEHLPEWAADTALRQTRANGVLNLVDIVEIDTPAGPLPFYRAEGHVGLPDAIDFALIDGPPESIGRGGTLFALWPHLADDAVVWLDDYQRKGEQRILKLWSEHLPITITERSRHVAEIRRKG